MHVFDDIYKNKRVKFLKTNLGLFNNDENILKLIKYIIK